jgi:hypothetical protein
MGSKKLVIIGGIVAAVAAAALLVPSLALGQPVTSVLTGAITTQDAGGSGSGPGKAWGHHKDSPDFPGQGKGGDSMPHHGNANGNANGNRNGNGNGNAFGHGKNQDNPHTEDGGEIGD